MLNILMTGVGGQGTVLAAKVLAQAAQDKGWEVRTGETIGMAQRGGSVISHIRMGNKGEEVYSSLLAKCSADLIVAFEPAEAVRVMPYLSADGLLVSATSGLQPVTATLGDNSYDPQKMIETLDSQVPNFVAVNDAALCKQAGTRKVLNMILLAAALKEGNIGLTIDDLKQAVKVCVKEQFVPLNLKAIESV